MHGFMQEMNMALFGVDYSGECCDPKKMVVDAGCYGRNVCTPCNLKL